MGHRRSSTAWVILVSALFASASINAFETVGKSIDASPSAEEKPNASDELAINALQRQMIESWDSGNGVSFAEAFTDDAAVALVGGKRVVGRQEIAATYQRLFDGVMRGSRLTSRVESLRFLTSNTAVVSAIAGTIMPSDKAEQGNQDFLQTLVALKQSGRWRIAALHDSRVLKIERQERSADHNMPASGTR